MGTITTPNRKLIITIQILMLIVFVLFIGSLVRNLKELLQMDTRLIAAKDELSALENKQAELEYHKQQVNSGQFDEAEIRNKLGLVKPDEVIVIIPELQSQEYANSLSTSGKSITYDLKPIWSQWLELFF